MAGAALLGVAVFALAALSIELTRGEGRVAVVWPVNAVILAVLLRQPMRLWPAYLASAIIGNITANLASGDLAAKAIGLALCNAAEVLVCSAWIRGFVGSHLDVTRPTHLGHFLLAGGLIAPAVSAVPAGLILAWGTTGAFFAQAVPWFAADALGLLIIVPVWTLLASQADWRGLLADIVSWRGAAAITAVAGALGAVAADRMGPAYFLIPPSIVFAAFMLRPAGAAVLMGLVASVMMAAAALGLGHASAMPGGLAVRLLHGQALLAVTTLSGLLVSTAVAARRRTEEKLKASIAQLDAARIAAEQSEARYRQVTEHASDVIARTSVRGEGLYMSPSVRDVVGYGAEELMANRPPFAPIIHPDDREATYAYYRELAGGDAAVAAAPVQYRARHRDGRWIWLESRVSVLRDRRGRPLEFVDVLRDITAHVELERALRDARQAAEEAARIKSSFIANMSHEIRTPLMAILGFADALVRRTDLPPDAQRRIAQIQGAGRGLMAIANDVLDFSRLEAGAVSIRLQPCDATELLVDTISIFEAQAEAKGLQLELSVAGLPDQLLLDGDRVRQILNNFVGNAIKFTEEGRVAVRARYDSPLLVLEVEDTGPGLAPEDLQKLFIRFSQVDGAKGRRHGGTGLGLAICKGLAEAMGGRVGVRSHPGRGSTFFAEIPAEAVSAPRAAPASGPRAGEAKDSGRRRCG